MARFVYLAFTDARPGKEAEFERWFEEQHIPDLLDVPGIVSVQRFAAVDAGKGLPAHRRHVALYELETDDPAVVLAELDRRRGTDQLIATDALNPESLFTRVLTPMSPPRKRES